MGLTIRRTAALVAAVAVAALGVLAGPGHERAEADPELATLLSLPDDQAGPYLEAHPELTVTALASRPDVVVDWWKDVDVQERDRLIAAEPQLVGNLEGIDYASRDAANRASLADRLEQARAAVTADPGDSDSARLLAALTAVNGALKGDHEPERHLVQLTDDPMPLAAVAIGDLDTARQVTFAVPGMGTYSDDMQLWAVAAENLHRAQGRAGAPDARAVVAWIGYVTPPPGLDATAGGYAARGAPLLRSDLRALAAVREGSRTGDPLEVVSIVAHSYGTTMAADALNEDDLGAHSFVMLGSAGVEAFIGSTAGLHADRVFAGEAALDQEAVLGRIQRVDPRSPAFGATVIGVDGDPARGLAAVTGHDPVLHSPYNDDPTSKAWTKYPDAAERSRLYAQHMQQFGYLDGGTQSLDGAARASLAG